MDSIVKPKDSEIFVEVSCLLNLQDSPVGIMSEPEELDIDHDHDPLATQLDKITHTTEVARELRAATSQESVRSYEQYHQAEKHFTSALNIRHVNKMPFTSLLRAGSDVCCYFNDVTRLVLV